jgi:hypothetical protein
MYTFILFTNTNVMIDDFLEFINDIETSYNLTYTNYKYNFVYKLKLVYIGL